jgi:hypothetical protein
MSVPSFAQETTAKTGSIVGHVKNYATKEGVISAAVVLQGTTIGAATDIDGNFVIKNIPVGTYSVRVSALGFLPMIKTDIVISVSKPADVHFEIMESELEVEGVTVTTEYFQKNPDAPISVQTLGAEEIRRLPGGLEDVVRAISILPGVAQVQNGRNDLIVRGGAPSENLFVIDNIEVSNINHFGTQGASGGPLSFVNLDFVSETSFKTGGFGAKYGDKLSSVLTIDLKDGREDRFGGKATISASQFGLNLEGPTGQNGSFLFSARRSYLDFIFKAAGFGFVPEYWDFLGKANYRLSPKDQVNVLSILALDNVKLFNDTDDKKYTNSRILSSDQTQFLGGVSWRHLLEKGFTNVTFSQNYVGYNYIQNDSLLQPIFKSTSDEYETSLRGDVVFQLTKASELSFGLFGKFVDFNSSIVLPDTFYINNTPLKVDATLVTTAVKSAGYAQYSRSIGDAVRMTLGGRIDYFDLITDNVAFSPRFSLSYAASPLLTFTGSVGRYHQAPSYIWLVANAANKNLKYVAVDQTVLGVEYLIRSDIKISLEGYVKQYSNYPASLARPYLVLANTGAGFGGSQDGYASFGLDPLVSDGAGIAKGMELFLQKKMSEIPCYGLVSISWNEARFTAIDGVERSSSFDQRWIINLGGGYILNDQWEFSGKFRLATGRPYTPYLVPPGIQDVTAYNGARIGANHSLDLRADRRWNFVDWTLITYIDVQNVYNRKALDVPIYDEREKRVKQASGGIALLPSIGVSAEF